jgi:hypothetical protein
MERLGLPVQRVQVAALGLTAEDRRKLQEWLADLATEENDRS